MKGMEMKMDQNPHFFFALKLPKETKLALKEYSEKLKESYHFRQWVHYEDFHITLAFLGFAPFDQRTLAVEKLQENISGTSTFHLTINRPGTFGKAESPRIFFAETEESNELQLVRQKVYTACIDAGFTLEKRPFRPHITLAKKWAGEESFPTEELDVLWKQLHPERITFKATDIVLYQTHLNKTPKYEEINLFSLENTQ
jgi:2'-5' RNA ligase